MNLNIIYNHDTILLETKLKMELFIFKIEEILLLKPLFVLFRYLNWLLRYEDSKLMLNVEDYEWVYDL